MSIYTEKLLYCFFFLICAFIVSGLNFSLQRLGKTQTKEELKREGFHYFPKLLRFFVAGHEWDAIWFSLNFSKLIFYLIFGISLFFFLVTEETLIRVVDKQKSIQLSALVSLLTVNTFIAVSITVISDFFVQFLCARSPRFWFKMLTTPCSILLTLTLPFTLGFLKFNILFFPKKTQLSLSPSFRAQDKILEWLKDSEVESLLEENEKKLIYSVISFKDRIAREVMVPRMRIFSISVESTISEATKYFLQEGYSRIPVYKENVDTIVGVLLYKDVLNLFIKNRGLASSLENKSIQSIIKPVVYTPETKKIAVLLQEFRNKQIHLAIVVNEYGGTEGIVTIEDILEELVGEIEDEYDTQNVDLFTSLAGGGWIIEAQMSVFEVEEELGIKIPSNPDYDTIGGYVFHKAGSIPSKGWTIHHDNFELEVLSSDERSINKIKITPYTSA
ncbi:MAG: HlyC/CorC family transporter [Chlamydiae bacterium]|nr:HlyC/CorC family transporter [Chlamydiota bacterium]